MNSALQHPLVQRHLPTAGFALGMALLGSLINQWPAGNQQVLVGQDILCQNIPISAAEFQLNNISSTVTAGQGVAFLFAVLLPLFPVLAQNPHPLQSLTREQQNFLTTHLIGQTSSFGSAELGRFFLVEPGPLFFSKCGLDREECVQRELTLVNLLLPHNTQQPEEGTDDAKSLCKKSDNTTLEDLYQNLHAMPDVRATMMGAASVIFVASLVFTLRDDEKEHSAAVKRRHFKKQHPFTKLVLIIAFLIFVSWFLVDRYKQLENSGAHLLLSFLLGVILQAFVNTFYQLKRRDEVVAREEEDAVAAVQEEEEEEIPLKTILSRLGSQKLPGSPPTPPPATPAPLPPPKTSRLFLSVNN